jgi:zinc transport system ATP-binding protein
MTDTPIISLDDIELRRGGKDILRGVSWRIARGEHWALIGPNGSGKTTLLRVILGLVKPDRGRVWLRPALRIGYMPQRLTVEDTLPLTVARFMTLGVRMPRRQIAAALAETGADQVLDSPLNAISGGELQRVMLARALLREPELLVLDEPVQSVDVTGQFELYDLLGEIRRRHGCAILMVSHDLHLVLPTADQVICMNHHICCAGPPELVSRHPAYRELFGTEHARLAIYRHHHDHRHDVHGDVVEPERVDG